MTRQPDPLRRGDYVAHWTREAKFHAKELRWPASRIPAVVRTLDDAFGAAWLREMAQKDSKYPLTGDPKKHPLARLIATADRTSTMTLIELAVYLRSCAKLPRFGEVLHHLRTTDQFTTGRMQLALAHRFLLAGCTDVELEPPAARDRKADLFFRYGGRGHLVECYEPAPVRNSHFDDLLHVSVDRIIGAAREGRRRVIVCVDLHVDYRSVDAAMRKRIEQEAQYLLRLLSPPALCEKKKLADFNIEVLDTGGISARDAHDLAMGMGRPGAWVMAPAMAERSDLPKISRGLDVPRTRVGWMVVNHKPLDAQTAMRRIADVIENKLAQVRRDSEEDVLGLMVAITDFAQLAARGNIESRPLVDALSGKVLGTHEGLAGVFLVDRADHEHRGPFIGGLFMQGREGEHLDGLHAAIASREESHRVIDDWID